jgi:hypothetical protein
VAVFLKNGTREIAASDNEYFLVILLQLFDESDEITITADNDECIDVVAGERHLQSIQGKVDISAVLVAAGREIALNHLDGVLCHAPAVLAGALPIAVSDFRDNFAALFDGFQDGANVEVAIKGAFNSDLDVVEVDEYSDLQSVLYHEL